MSTDSGPDEMAVVGRSFNNLTDRHRRIVVSDSYQAIYDAARSRIGYCDTGEAIASALRDAFGDASWRIAQVISDYSDGAYEMARPFVTLKPAVYIDGNQWCALYGENLQDGVAGFGDSPALAASDFDKNWFKSLAA